MLKPARLTRALGFISLSSSLALISPQLFANTETSLERISVIQAGSIMSQTESEVVRPVAVIEGEQMEQRRAGTIGEALDGLPGISNADFGPGVGRPVIRGLQGSRVAILEDGARVSDVSGEGADHAVASSTLRADSVEVIRGPATLLYGSGASGGVVNVVSGRFSPIIGDRANGAVQASYGLNGHDRRSGVALELPVSGEMAIRLDADYRQTDNFSINGFQTSDGEGKRNELLNSDVENRNLAITGIYAGERGFLGIGFSQWNSEYGIPEADEDDYDRIEAESKRFDLKGELYDPLPGFNTARFSLAYTDFYQEEWEYEVGARELEAIFKQQELDLRLELTHDPIANWTGVIGLDFNNTKFEAEDDGDAFFIRPSERNSIGIFSMQERPTSWGQFELGFRLGYDHFNPKRQGNSTVAGDSVTFDNASIGTVNFDPNPGTKSYLNTGIALGALFDLDSDHKLRAGISRSEAAPGPEQLYAFGRHGAAGLFEVGNPDLTKETYLNTEISLLRQQGSLRYEATAFVNLVDNFIYYQNDTDNRRVDGNGNDKADGELLVYNAQDDAIFYGVELNGAVDLATQLPLTLRASGDYLRGELRDGGNLPRMTPPRIGLGADTRWSDFKLSVDYRYHFKQTQTAEAEDTTDGFATLGFDLAYYPANIKDLRLFLQGRNLTNESGRLHQSFFKNEAPISGRNFTAGVRYQF
ncbi:TonB-dependent receptor [Thiomicrospira cyclica]|uniref:Outer membrane insertion C-terminal signal n=1 Tax=Thiomicrospira cyclica (strain DSM 14477 / JCM 11371 / ALM1) TaxID=717773 RepID=F6DAG6_THICA|nr:TonB-dependent receptor [Thiomicrospira cyclica]AEG32222.1 outer membrane insertion C-terminal signal [Thiomicrospira cyclica ALM1]